MIGAGAGSQTGTAKEFVIASHYVPGHWCCTAADLNNRRLVYYGPFYDDPYRAGALSALGAYVDQVSPEQGAEVPIGAAAFESTVHKSPRQPDGISCGVCVLIKIQRVVDGK